MISIIQYLENDFISAPLSSVPLINTSPQIKLIKTEDKKKKQIKDYNNINESYQILNERERLQSSREMISVSNKIRNRPKGIIIQDSYNNPFLSIRPRPQLDTSKVDLIEIHKRYKELYSKFYSDFLPWHYCIELVEDRYTVFNTRPIDMKFPITNEEIKKRDDLLKWDDLTNIFFKENLFDISECIHVMIIGDSNIDIYTNRIYKIIGRVCISPFLRYFKLPEGIFQRTFPLNLGKKFKINILEKYVRR